MAVGQKRAAGLLWTLSLAVGAPGWAADRVGQFLDVTGGVTIQRGAQRVKAYLLSGVLSGDIVRVPAGGQAELVLDRQVRRVFLLAGSECRVEPERVVTLNAQQPMVKRSLEATLRLPPLGRRFAGLVQRSLGGPCTPVGAVRQEPVTLNWQGVPANEIGTREVQVEIRAGSDADAAEGLLVHQQRLPAATRRATVPAGKLKPGQPYVWLVREVEEGVPSEGCLLLLPLRLLEPGAVGLLKELESVKPATAADWLAQAVIYERYHLLDDAHRAYREADRLNPGRPELARSLRRLEQARKGLPARPEDEDSPEG